MDDPQWQALGDKAVSAGMSISQLIRFALLDDDGAEVEARHFRPESPATPMSQAQRDAILRRVSKGN